METVLYITIYWSMNGCSLVSFIILALMLESHIPDYGSRLRSDSATARKVKKSDNYPQWSGMSYHCLNVVVYHCRVTVWSLSDRILMNRVAVRTDSVIFYHAKDTNRIRIGLRTGESGWIRLETAESGRFLNNIWLLSWLNKCFYKSATNHRILIRLLTKFNREWSYQGRQ